MFRSFRTKLQAAFVGLGLAAIGVVGWQASAGASEALQQAGYDRLTAIRETRASELERYFINLQNQVLALAVDESTLTAIEQLPPAWSSIPPFKEDPAALKDYHRRIGAPPEWFPTDPRTLTLQTAFLADNPHPSGNKDLLLAAPSSGIYSDVHARFHPTFHRFKTAFGFYDIFLLGPDGRVLYTVMKEIDLGVSLNAEPYLSTPLASVYRKALATDAGAVALEDYVPYAPSAMAPAAFLAAPLRRAGQVAGVLAAQVAIDEVNNVMDGGGRWREQGLGETGQTYVIGPDKTLRSDLRRSIEAPEAYLNDLTSASIPTLIIENIRRTGTAVLAYPIDLAAVTQIRAGEQGTEIGRNTRGAEVLRTHAPLNIGNLNWTIVAEIENQEATAPVRSLQRRILTIGLVTALIFFFAARWFGASVTGPILVLASIARRVGKGERGLRVSLASKDEIGQLAADFNRMSDDLERTTVSRDEYKILAGRLITAQEDERNRIARELHDDFTQRLAAAAIEAGRLEKHADSPEPVRGGLGRLKQAIAGISDEVHDLSRRLHPAMLDDLGLVAAMEAECRAAFERGGPVVHLEASGAMQDLPKDAQLALYRITQEALRNMQRHANATEAEVLLTRRPHGVQLRIRDNGEGFDRTQPDWKPGLGLASMEERVRLLGGQLSIDSKPGQGTSIVVSLPDSKEPA